MRSLWHIFAILIATLFSGFAAAESQHGVAMHGEPSLSKGFTHFPYVNPEAVKGGKAVFGETGSFDSLNPFVLKGKVPWPVSALTVESLMARSYDEPFTLYGLLAESIEMPEDRSWVAFTLREDARFSDGAPVTVEDVIWSFRTLGTEGHPRYRGAWSGVREIAATGPRTVRIDLAEPNRELPLILGLRPILQKAQFDGLDFADAANVKVTGSGPYQISAEEPGRFIEFTRNPDWWGADLPVNRGLHNFETVRFDYFRNRDALMQAVSTGAVSLFHETDPVRWAEGYDVPTIADGTLRREELDNQRPTGMEGFAFNTRRAIFEDRRVREALALSFDWEWVNERLYRGQYARIQSYFGNSALAHSGAASVAERALLEPFAADLPEGTLEAGWAPPVSDGTGRDRRALRKAAGLLDQAGWPLVDGVRANAKGEPLAFEILVQSSVHETLASLWRDQLARIGVEVTVRLVDSTQYELRQQDYDYDMIVYLRRMSLSPGNEQRYYFGSQGRDQPGTRNYMGIADPAVDAMIDKIVTATDPGLFQNAVRALDRVLSAGIYVIPFGVLPNDRIIARREMQRPANASLYGWWGWFAGPGVWWIEP